MTRLTDRIAIFIAFTISLGAVFCAAFFSSLLYLLIPLGILMALVSFQHPQLLFYGMLASIPFSYEFQVGGTLSTDIPDEPLMILMSAVVLAILSYHRRSLQVNHFILLLVAIHVGWILVTALVSTHQLISLKFFLAKSWYVLAFFLAPVVLGHTISFWRNAALVLLFSMLAVTLISLVKHAGLGFSFAAVNEALAPFFRNHVNYSALLVCIWPLLIALYTLSKSNSIKNLAILSLLVVLAALYLSYSRGAWLALMAGLLAYWLIRKSWLVKTYLFVILFASAAVVWLQHKNNYLQFAPHHDTTIFHQNFSEHLAATYKGKDVSTAERFYRWVAGARMATEEPLTGFGPGTFYQNYRSYTTPLFRTWVSVNRERSTVHNYFLLVLVEQGIIGLLLFLVLIGIALYHLQKVFNLSSHPFWRSGAAAVSAILYMLCTVNFLSDLVETDKVGSIFFICLAFAVAATKQLRTTIGRK